MGLRTGAARSYYLFDGLGSVVAVTDASGNVTNSYTVQPSLPPAQGQNQRHKCSGDQHRGAEHGAGRCRASADRDADVVTPEGKQHGQGGCPEFRGTSVAAR